MIYIWCIVHIYIFFWRWGFIPETEAERFGHTEIAGTFLLWIINSNNHVYILLGLLLLLGTKRPLLIIISVRVPLHLLVRNNSSLSASNSSELFLKLTNRPTGCSLISVFSLKFCDFSELCQFCCSAGECTVYTHWHRGKTEKGKSPE